MIILNQKNNISLNKALIEAIQKGESAADIKKRIDDDADVNARDWHKKTPLMWAGKYSQDPEILHVLLEAGADVDAQDLYRITALMEAVKWNRNIDITRFLIESGADVNIRNRWGEIALHHAVSLSISSNEVYQIVSLLIEAGSNPNAETFATWFGGSVVDYALERRRMDLVVILVDAGATVEPDRIEKLGNWWEAKRRKKGKKKP